MEDIIVWVIIAAFYAPMHFLLPVLVLFVTGSEPESVRRALMRGALQDAALSMAVAFAIVIALVAGGWMLPGMLVLLLSMGYPFLRIWRHRREIGPSMQG